MWRMSTFDSREQPGHVLRHFIDRRLRPDVRAAALANEPDQLGYGTDELALKPKPKPKPKDIVE
jgi:hypothetical protein